MLHYHQPETGGGRQTQNSQSVGMFCLPNDATHPTGWVHFTLKHALEQEPRRESEKKQ